VGARLVGAAVARLISSRSTWRHERRREFDQRRRRSDEGAESVAGVPIALPSILIETVSAGGGASR